MTLSTALDAPQDQLLQRWSDLKQEQPKLRIRNAAAQLGVSELELLLTKLGDSVTLLENQFPQILRELEKVGKVMALTRNEQVVHERHGVYTDFTVNKAGNMGLCLGEIDLRAFFRHWYVALAVEDRSADTIGQVRKSIQFFDIEGTAVHKVYLTSETVDFEWDTLIKSFTAESQVFSFNRSPIPAADYPNKGKLATEEVYQPWTQLKDVHHFQAMLKKLGIDRLEALQLVGQEFARELPLEAVEKTLHLASKDKLDIMVFVGNGNIVQIHTGAVNKLLRTGPWFNVLDPDFNLHVNTDEITRCWLVKRPTNDGIVTSVECFNKNRDIVITFFGARKQGEEELSTWRTLTETLESV